jgi:hypothetical protein
MVKDVKDFITCRRFETLSLHTVIQGFSTSDCEWLIPPGPGARQQRRVSATDALKRKEILEEFLFWFFDSFVLPLIRVDSSDFHCLSLADRSFSRHAFMSQSHQLFEIGSYTSDRTIGLRCVRHLLRD